MRSCSSKRPERPEPPEITALGRWFAVRVLLFAALAVPLLLRLRLPRLRDCIEPRPSRPFRDGDLPPAAVEAIILRVDALLAAGRPFVRTGCLTRGVTLYYFLRRCGVPVSLRFGMGEVNGSFAGHCWLDLSGEPLVERRDPRPLFVETYRIAPGQPRQAPHGGPA